MQFSFPILTSSQPTVANGSQVVQDVFGRSIYLFINIVGTPTGTTPSITFTITELDPSDLATSTGLTTSSAALTSSGETVLGLSNTRSVAFKVSWVLANPDNSFAVSVTLTNKDAVPVDSSGTVLGTPSAALASSPVPSTYATYVCCDSWTPAASPQDTFVLIGSASKTVRLVRLDLWLVNSSTTGAAVLVSLFKRSSLDTGSAISPTFRTAYDSTDPAATALVKHYTTNPSANGTSVGAIRQDRVFLPGTATSGGLVAISWTWGGYDIKLPTLNIDTEAFYVNLGGTNTYASAVARVEWMES